MNEFEKNKNLEALKKIIEEREKLKDNISTCDWCGMTYPKGGWKFYKITVMNMNIKKIVESIEKGEKENFDVHIICSDCYEHLEECKEC